MDIITLALAKKYTDSHKFTLTPEIAEKVITQYFSENPGAIVTDEELATSLLDYLKTADLDSYNFIQDENYVHTDNNYTTEEKTKLNGFESWVEAKNYLTEHQDISNLLPKDSLGTITNQEIEQIIEGR